VAQDDQRDPWLRSAGAYWAARAAALGDRASANSFLRLAAQAPHTFYGMIAERQVRPGRRGRADRPLVLAAYRAPDQDSPLRRQRPARPPRRGPDPDRPLEEARAELRAGLAMARTADERKTWKALIDAWASAAAATASHAPT
jgi:hypothetical protein